MIISDWSKEGLKKVVCGKCKSPLKYLGYPLFYCSNCDETIVYASEELPLTESVSIPMKSSNETPRVFEPKITLQVPEGLINPEIHVHTPKKPRTRKKTWLEKKGKKTVQIEEEEEIGEATEK